MTCAELEEIEKYPEYDTSDLLIGQSKDILCSDSLHKIVITRIDVLTFESYITENT